MKLNVDEKHLILTALSCFKTESIAQSKDLQQNINNVIQKIENCLYEDDILYVPLSADEKEDLKLKQKKFNLKGLASNTTLKDINSMVLPGLICVLVGFAMAVLGLIVYSGV